MKIIKNFKKNKKKLLPFAIGVVVILVPLIFINLRKTQEVEAAWHSDGWRFRKKIVVDSAQVSGSSDLIDFPILVSVTDTDLQSAQSDGDDFLFVAENGEIFDHEIESWDSGTGNLVAWVRIPTLFASEDTSFYLYYGNISATNQQNPDGVWNDNYFAVYHLNENVTDETSSGTHFDSTKYNVHGSQNGNSRATGVVSGGQDFDGSYDDYIDTNLGSTLDGRTTFTIETWMRRRSSNDTFFLGNEVNTFDDGINIQMYDPYDELIFSVGNGEFNGFSFPGTDVAWHHISMVYDGAQVADADEVRVYFDGSYQAFDYTGSNPDTAGTPNIPFLLGALRNDDIGSGYLDEVRIYKNAVSSDWAITSFNTQNSPGTFLSFGTEETGPTPLAWWRFDEGTGSTAEDSTTNNYDGTLGVGTTAPSWQTSDFCISGNCLYFDGVEDRVSFGDLDILDSTDMTISTWIKVTDYSADEGTIFSKWDGITSNRYTLRVETDGKIKFLKHGSSCEGGDIPGICEKETTDSISLNKWHYITLVYDDDALDANIYIDGELATLSIDETFLAGLSTGSDSNLIGRRGDNNDEFNGFIDEMKIYPYERTAAEIKQDYNFYALNFGRVNNNYLSNGLVGYWKMDETALNGCAGGEDSCDDSGNGNHGTWETSMTTADIVAGRFDKGVQFDGIDDYIIYDNAHSTESEEYTISAWVQTSATAGEHTVLSRGRADLCFYNPYIYVDDTGTTLNVRESGCSSSGEVGAVSVNTGEWNHIVVTREQEVVKVYLNGSLALTDNSTPDPNGTANAEALIGARKNDASTYGNFTPDTIDEIRVYDRALSTKEVEYLHDWGPSPELYFKFNEGSGTTNVSDSSGNNYTGTMNGTMTSADWVEGVEGYALDFDGSDDNIEINTAGSPINIDETFTVSAWIYPRSDGEGDNGNIFARDGEFSFYITNTNDLEGYYEDSFSSIAGGGIANLTLNAWNHVAFVKTTTGDSRDQLYINGAEVSTGNATSGTNTDDDGDNLIIGSETGTSTSYSFDGLIDEVKIYNYARTPAQVQQDYKSLGNLTASASNGGSRNSVYAYWKFDQGYGDTAYDSGPNEINGDLGNSDTTCPGGGTDCPTWTPNGKIGGAFDFDGGDQIELAAYPYLGAEGLNPTKVFSASAWVKSDQTGTGSNGAIVSLEGCGQTQYKVSVVGGTIDFTIEGATEATGNTNINSGGSTWHHIAVTWDVNKPGDNVKIYVNGVEDGTGSKTDVATDSFQSAKIGASSCSSYWDGMIDEVKFYDYALTPEDVLRDFNGGGGTSIGVVGNSEATDIEDGAGNDPILYFDLDENSGTTTVFDKSGNGNNGLISGGMTAQNWVKGIYGSALYFDGSNGYVNVGSPTILDNLHDNAFTVEAWIKADGWGEHSSSGGTILRKGPSDSTGWRLTLRQTSPSGLFGQVNAATTNAYSASGIDEFSIDGNWHHVAMTWDDAGDRTVHLWIDGKEVTSYASQVTASGVIDTDASENIQLGGWGGAYSFDGNIDEVKIYNYVRTPSQIAYDYNRGKPIAHWKFDECQGNTLYDSSGNNYHGTISAGDTSGTNDSIGTCSSGNSDEMWANGATGVFNSSLDFDGANDVVTVSHDPGISFGDESFSLTAWVKVDADSNSTIIEKDGSWILHYNAGNDWFAFGEDGGSITQCNPLGGITLGQWYFVTGIWNAENTNGYCSINALNQYVNSSVNITENTNDIYIGENDLSTQSLNGQIDDVQIYSYILSQSQIEKIMNNSSSVRFSN